MDFGFYVLLFFYLSRCRTIFLVSRLIFFFFNFIFVRHNPFYKIIILYNYMYN